MPSILHEGDCRTVLPTLAESSFDSVVTDPPYELGFMGKSWDASGVAFDPLTWAATLRVLKPGGYMLCFGGTRTYHRLACAVEDAGFEIRDCLMWLYGAGMPKGQGCLKPAWEPILLARKLGKKVLPLGVDACRVPLCENEPYSLEGKARPNVAAKDGCYSGIKPQAGWKPGNGRYPANVLHDGSDEVMELFPETTGNNWRKDKGALHGKVYGGGKGASGPGGPRGHNDTGTAARFFYCAKASKSERGKGNTHPTVKPVKLSEWLVKLVTPPGGTVLDPFAGSGTTLMACEAEGRECVGIEQDAKHCKIIRKRLEALRKDAGLFAA